MTLRELCNLYLRYQHSKVLADDLTPKHHNDQISSLSKLMFPWTRSKDREYFNFGFAELQKEISEML